MQLTIKRLPLHLFLAAVSMLYAPCSASSFEAECAARLPPSKISVTTGPSQIQYDFSRSIWDLTAKQNQHNKGGVTLGLTETQLKIDAQWSWNQLTDAEGRTCLRPSAQIFVSVNPQTVYIGREFQQGTCAFNEIAIHELRHVHSNQDHMERVADFYQNELNKVFVNQILYGSAAELKAKVNNAFKEYWSPRISADLGKVRYAHELIDTPLEYAKNNVICQGAIPAILRQYAR